VQANFSVAADDDGAEGLPKAMPLAGRSKGKLVQKVEGEAFTLHVAPEYEEANDTISLSSDDLGIDPYYGADDHDQDAASLDLDLAFSATADIPPTLPATATVVIDNFVADATATIEIDADANPTVTIETDANATAYANANVAMEVDEGFLGDIVDADAKDDDELCLDWTQTMESQAGEAGALPTKVAVTEASDSTLLAVQAQALTHPLSSTPVAATGMPDRASGSSAFSLTLSPARSLAQSLTAPLAPKTVQPPLAPHRRPFVPPRAAAIDLTSQSQSQVRVDIFPIPFGACHLQLKSVAHIHFLPRRS
jgi:hypothetical protein